MNAVKSTHKYRGSVRLRIALAATLVFALAATAAALLLVHGVESTLRARVHDRTVTALEGATHRIEAGTPPDAIATVDPSSGAVVFVQVLDRNGKPIVSTTAAGTARAVGSNPVAGTVTIGEGAILPGAGVLSVGRAVRSDGALTVVASSSLEDVRSSVATITLGLWVAIPLLVAIVGAVAWVLAGRALRPVEAIRAEAETITARHLHRRVPEPASNDEIARLARTVNKMLDGLEEAQASQHRFISDASHELRSPIASFQAAGEVALAHPDQRDWRSVMQDMLIDGARLDELVGELLALASLDEQTSPPTTDVDLSTLIIDEARRTTTVAVELKVRDGVLLTGDEPQLRRLVRNLLDNAVRHAHHQIAVHLTQTNSVVILDVDDDGPGIPVPLREHVFERFARLDESRSRDAGGAGLGLAMARTITELHGGNMSALDAPTLGGARLSVRLPLSPANASQGPSDARALQR